jgi:hypothetical protein
MEETYNNGPPLAFYQKKIWSTLNLVKKIMKTFHHENIHPEQLRDPTGLRTKFESPHRFDGFEP